MIVARYHTIRVLTHPLLWKRNRKTKGKLGKVRMLHQNPLLSMEIMWLQTP